MLHALILAARSYALLLTVAPFPGSVTGNEVMPGHELFHSNFFPLMSMRAGSVSPERREEGDKRESGMGHIRNRRCQWYVFFNCPYIATGSSQPSCFISESFTSFHTDISMEHHSRVGEGPVFPLLLVLGFTNGYSIWQILVRDHTR